MNKFVCPENRIVYVCWTWYQPPKRLSVEDSSLCGKMSVFENISEDAGG